MDALSPLLERTRSPHPSIQRFAVISIFHKLRSAPDSSAAKSSASQCLASFSAAVVDQSIRETCRLVADSKLELPEALVELQAALEGCPARLVNVFVKGIGFVCRLGFKRDPSWGFQASPETHPFVKLLVCRAEAHEELLHQVLVFIMQNKSTDVDAVLNFLKPFVMFALLRVQSSNSLSSFAGQLLSSIAALGCSRPLEAISIFRFAMTCMRYIPCSSADEFKLLCIIAKHLTNSYILVLKQLAAIDTLKDQAQICGVEIAEALLSVCAGWHGPGGGIELVIELTQCLMHAQKELGLPYLTKFNSVVTSLFLFVVGAEIEHEQICTLKLALFLLEWKDEDVSTSGSTSELREEILFVFPALNLLSSPSGSLKAVATDLLALLERHLAKVLRVPVAVPFIAPEFPAKLGDIIQRFLYYICLEDQSASSTYSFLQLACGGKYYDNMILEKPNIWISQLKHFSFLVTESRKSGANSQHQEAVATGIPSFLCAITFILVMHHNWGTSAAESFADIYMMDSTLAMPLLLTILFLNKFLCSTGDSHEILLKLWGTLPYLASDPVMVPIVLQTTLPMLQKNAKPVLYATAVRLLCKTWMVTDRVFGSLQEILQPAAFSEFSSEKEICLSMAASVRDVCRKDPDRGVDLILSISACVEAQEPSLQSLGFESLAHLCEADVVDFYTAWDVISRYTLTYSCDPVVAHGLCDLLRWGAMDAEAYPEASQKVVQILWDIGTTKTASTTLWVKAQIAALQSLVNYEVEHIRKCISDFNRRNIEALTSEENPEVLGEMEKFEVKTINYEHITRRRLQNEEKHMGNRVEKLLHVIPQAIFSSGSSGRKLPAAAILCFDFNPKDIPRQGKPNDPNIVENAYLNALMEITESLQISRNIVIALLLFQSWKPFMHRWTRAVSPSSGSVDKISLPASDILKIMCERAELSVPRTAESMALAIGALASILPPSSHGVTSTAAMFLLKWLFQYEHEHRQWTSALSLGLLSSCASATDTQQNYQIIMGLLEVASISKSTLVKGACGAGLGFACQGLLMGVEPGFGVSFEKGTLHTSQHQLLSKIVRSLCSMISQLCPSADDSLQGLCQYFELVPDDISIVETTDADPVRSDSLEEDVWGVVGLVLGLGNSIMAMYKGGYHEAVLKVKDILISWIPCVNFNDENSYSSNGKLELQLSVGSCLVLPIVVAFCWRMELIDDELDHIVTGYRELITELLDVKSGTLHQSLLMASCIGVGNFVSYILNGVRSVKSDDLKALLELIRNTYTHLYPPPIHLGGMLGVVNIMGASAGIFSHAWLQPSSLEKINVEKKDLSCVRGPILLSPVCEQLCLALLQEMLSVARNSNDQQLQQYSAWALAFLRHQWLSKEFQYLNVSKNKSTEAKQSSQNFPEDTVVWQLSSWLMELSISESGAVPCEPTVATVLRCLSNSPRLPTLGWGTLIRRLMKYKVQVSDKANVACTLEYGTLREECINFSVAHANSVSPLLLFLDDLVEISRFRTLTLNLQCSLLSHLGNLSNIFSVSRLEKLFVDLFDYISSSSYEAYNLDEKSLLRTSFWKGLYKCLSFPSSESEQYISRVEKCMEVLFQLLPSVPCGFSQGKGQIETEWLEAVRCLGMARHGCLMVILQDPFRDMVQNESPAGVVKKIKALARLVIGGCIPMTELRKLNLMILRTKFDGMWNALLEVVAAIQKGQGSTRRQWLLDAIEISCITNYPSTALQFLGLLSSRWCQYMPLLIIDQTSVLSDLPVTLSSLLSDSSWSVIAGPAIQSLWASTERIHAWAMHLKDKGDYLGFEPIDSSEIDKSIFLARTMHSTCLALVEHLPFDKQLKLANMVVL